MIRANDRIIICIEGTIKDQIFTGKGHIKYFKNALYDVNYEGDIVDNNAEGVGKYTLKNGNIYEGETKNNEFCGKG